MGIFDHSSRSAFVKSDTDVGDWLVAFALIHPKGVLSGWGQDSVQVSQVLPHQTRSSMWAHDLCTVMLEQEGAIPKLFPQKLGAWNCPKSLGMLKHSVRVNFTGTKGPSPAPEKQPYPIIPASTKLYTWHSADGQVPFPWQPPNPDSSIRLPDGEAWFVAPENASPLL